MSETNNVVAIRRQREILSTPPIDDREDLIWLAGLIEGEGCIDSIRTLPRIRLTMTDRDVVERAATIMGTSVRMILNPTCKTAFSAEMTGFDAAQVIWQLLPLLGSRRSARAGSVLAAWLGRVPGPMIRQRPTSTEVLAAA